MKGSIVIVVCWGLLFIFASLPGVSEKMRDVKALDLSVKPQDTQTANPVKPDLDFGKFPLYFIDNNGQMNETAVFCAKTSRYTLWLTRQGLVFDSLKKVEAKTEAEEQTTDLRRRMTEGKMQREGKFARDVSRFIFLNANKNPEMVPIEETPLKVNYFIGHDKTQWHGDISTYQAVLYKNLYKNIDLKVYGIEKQIEYDWIVRPGGNPADIIFSYQNAKDTRLDHQGNLLIDTNFGELIHKKPVSYQNRKAQSAERKAQSEGVGTGLHACPQERKEVNVIFKKIAENTYGFTVSKYDKSCELIIDPVVLAYSTYIGGDGGDSAYAITVDGSKSVYVTGNTYSTDFPIHNQYQTLEGWLDVFVTKIDTTRSGESSLIYSTYLGGGSSEYGRGITVDNSGYAYVTGFTYSTDFPVLNQYQSDQPDGDAFVTKLDTSQSGVSSLIYSTYLGGGDWDLGLGIAVDSSGYAYVSGRTDSNNFPVRNQFQDDQPWADSFVTKLDTTQSGASSLIYSTYLGGGSYDYGHGIAVDSSGYAYVTGWTGSDNFPVLNQFQDDQPLTDAFVAKLDTTQSGASSLIYSTYLGGGSYDYSRGIAVDGSGNAYVTGYTYSINFPARNKYQSYKGNCDAFVTRIDTTKIGASSLIYSTHLGGGLGDLGFAIAVDNKGNAYVTGYTESEDFPTLEQYQTDQAYRDVFVSKLDTTRSGTSSLIYSTYLGSDGDEYGYGIAVDKRGNAYVTGYTDSMDFPTMNPFQSIYQGGFYDAFVAVFKPPYTPPSDIDSYIQDLPDTCFKNNANQRKNALHNKLMEVQALIDAGYYQEAINKLIHDIRGKVDGTGNNDWITCSYAQQELTDMIDSLIEYLEGLL